MESGLTFTVLFIAGFIVFVVAMLLLDLLVFHRRAHAIGWREAAGWSVFWIALALAFNLGLYLWLGRKPALEFLTGYLIEESLSVDNLFVFLMIFSYFKVPAQYQHRVLFLGDSRGDRHARRHDLHRRRAGGEVPLGALRLRRGAPVRGVQDGLPEGEGVNPEHNPFLKLLRRRLRITPDFEGGGSSSAGTDPLGDAARADHRRRGELGRDVRDRFDPQQYGTPRRT